MPEQIQEFDLDFTESPKGLVSLPIGASIIAVRLEGTGVYAPTYAFGEKLTLVLVCIANMNLPADDVREFQILRTGDELPHGFEKFIGTFRLVQKGQANFYVVIEMNHTGGG